MAALVHFSLELFVFRTMSLKSAANPLIIAGQLLSSYSPASEPAEHFLLDAVMLSMRALPLQ